jgi:L-ascorbate metabolism protein UlaG (beta-lactamase superfamily)
MHMLLQRLPWAGVRIAVAAAVILDAKTLVPIHYGTMHHPPIYHETADIAARLEAAAANKIRVDMIGTAEILRL